MSPEAMARSSAASSGGGPSAESSEVHAMRPAQTSGHG
jgi:hypothetical protein